MSEPPDPGEEICHWLTSLHLPQYAEDFQLGGLLCLEDCRGLSDQRLLELRVFPTGHRRRILRRLEAHEVAMKDKEEGRARRKPIPLPRQVFMTNKKIPQGTEQMDEADNDEEEDGNGFRAVSPMPPRPPRHKPDSVHFHPSPSPSSSCDSLSSHSGEVPSDWEISSEETPHSSTGSSSRPGGASSEIDQEVFQGEMVTNDIYDAGPNDTTSTTGLRPTRSYKLRHRPVPEIPDQVILPPTDWTTPPPVTSTTNPEAFLCDPGSIAVASLPTAQPRQIVPYGETFLYNNTDSLQGRGDNLLLQDDNEHKLRKKHVNTGQSVNDEEIQAVGVVYEVYEEEYSTVDECPAYPAPSNQGWSKAAMATAAPALPGPPPAVALTQGGSLVMVPCALYSEPFDAVGGLVRKSLPRIPVDHMDNISPYACFYGAPKTQFKMGWLDKLSPQGKCVYQKRWVKLDGDNLCYYNNDKEVYSKGLIPCSVVKTVRAQGDNRFEVVTTLRTFVFRAEREGERQEWVEALRMAMQTPASISQKPQKFCANKHGSVELKGYKGRVFISLTGTRFRLCKSEQDFKAGLGIALVDLTAANLKDTDRRGFEINTPFRTFCFTAESEAEKEEWTDAVEEAIAETLSDYEVAEKIWFNESNRTCADCRAPQPEWASINLGVVICKKCAGQHRFLGPSLSKVRSLKLDSTIWSNELVELFLEVGNKNANSFWAASLPLQEEIHMRATSEQRATFHRRKYRERKYCRVLEGLHSQQQLNQALCAAVVLPDVMETMALVYSGANVMCATGDPVCSTPYLLAQSAGQRLQMEFLHHNRLSDFPKLECSQENCPSSDAPSFMDGFLYCSAGPAKVTLDRRGRDDMTQRWCTLEGGFLSYYESERTATAIGRVDLADVVSLAVNSTETMTGAGIMFTMELYLLSDKVLVLGAKTLDTQQDWLHAIAKCFVPPNVEAMLRRGCELIGRLYYKEGHDLYHWRVGWFSLEGSVLYFSSGEEKGSEMFMRLKQLQELTVSTQTEGEELLQVLLMVEGGRTVYVHGFNKADFALWHSAIQLAAGTDGRALGNQQLSKKGVPIIVESCIAFVTQYGLCREGVYRSGGDPGRVARLLEAFRRDARSVKLHIQEHQLEDVTDTLKTFLSQSEDALLTKELYPYWVSVLDELDEKRRAEKYFTFIQSLPKVNSSTLAGLLHHLYGLQNCSHINQMGSRDLACVFSSCLFQTEGQTDLEVSVVQDLINNYVQLFGVNEDQLKQMERENSFITRWNEKKDTTFSPAGDLIFEVYLERRVPENCCLIKVSPTMRSDELAESALVMRNVVTSPLHPWTTFEVIENGELERPLHYKEKVLEQVLEWSTLDDPSSAFLVIKKFGEDKMADTLAGNKQKQLIRGEQLKFNDGSSKLLSGHKFQDRYVNLRDEKLLLYKEIKSTKPEREIALKFVKCYLGLKRKLKPPTSWGFTVYTDKLQWHFCCDGKESQIGWVNDIITMKHGGDVCSKSRDERRPSASTTASAAQRSPQDTKRESREDASVNIGELRTRSAEDAVSLQHRSAIVADLLKKKERLFPSETGQRRASEGIIQPRLTSSGVETRGPRSGDKSPNRKPVPGGGRGLMPPNLLNELNSVLNKTGRSAKEEKI